MIRIIHWIEIAALLLLAGCQATHIGYEMDARISPYIGQPAQYQVRVTINKIVPGAKPELFWQAELLTMKDKPAEARREQGDEQVIVTALISEKDGNLIVDTSATVIEKGTIAWSGSQNLTVPH